LWQFLVKFVLDFRSAMSRCLVAEDGSPAKVGETSGFWLRLSDFVSSETKDCPTEVSVLEQLGFPRNWPAVYSSSPALKSLIGKKGLIPAKKVAVAGVPTAEDWSRVPKLEYLPAQSFQNARRAAAKLPNSKVVEGWAILECFNRPAGDVFVAEPYCWLALEDGRWIDVTPRPEKLTELLLAEASNTDSHPSRRQSRLSQAEADFHKALLDLRFGAATGSVTAAPSGGASKAAAAPKKDASERAATATTLIAPASTTAAAPAQVKAPVVQPAARKGLDYSKFDLIEDSDDERLVVKQEPITLPMGLPRDAVSREEYDKVWKLLLGTKDLPFTPPPDLDQMWGYYKYGAMDEQALLDQACEYLGKFPCRLEPSDYKAKTYTLMKKLETEGREDEARMWSVICILRFPKDSDAYYNQGVLLSKMSDAAKFGGAPMSRLPSLEGKAKMVPTEQYCSLFSRASASYYRRCLKVDPKQRPAYINLIGCLERNEPTGWYEEVHDIAVNAVKNGIWYNRWQRPPHFVPQLEAKPWHNPQDFELCRRLEEYADVIRGEYEAYMTKLANRKDWDDSDTTPGPGDVGGRAGALHDGGLKKSGRWREVPLFANMQLQKEYATYFPETVRVLQTYCRDATGLALCGGGDVIFSSLAPGTRLRPHCGPSNSRLTCHLGIRIPRTKEQGCFVRVAAEEPRGWEEGKTILFDDSFEHEVQFHEGSPQDPYPGERVVLLVNFWHKDFEFKNDPEWRNKSDEMMRTVDVETLPKTAVVKAAEPVPAA